MRVIILSTQEKIQEEKQSVWRLSEELVKLLNKLADKKKKDANEQKKRPGDKQRRHAAYSNSWRKPDEKVRELSSLRGMELDIEVVVLR
jgi:hypothetical protein